MNPFVRIGIFASAVVVVIVAFAQSFWLGLLAVLLLIAWLLYRGRAPLYMLLGNASHAKGDREAALLRFRKAYEAGPLNPAIAPYYGYYLLKSGDIGQAEKVLTAFLEAGPDGRGKLDAKMNLALVRWKQGRLQEATDMLEEVHGKIKTTALYGSLGYLYIESGDLEKALCFNQEAYDYNDSDPVILDNLCLTHMRRGEWTQAEEICRKMTALSPKFPEAHYHAGLILLHSGDKEAALEKFDEALRLPLHALSTVTREEIAAKRRETAEALGLSDAD